MTSSIKPEVHNVLQPRYRRTESRPLATCTKFGKVPLRSFRVVSGQTDRQTNRYTDYNNFSILTGGELINLLTYLLIDSVYHS